MQKLNVTDRQTDRQTDGRTDGIAISPGPTAPAGDKKLFSGNEPGRRKGKKPTSMLFCEMPQLYENVIISLQLYQFDSCAVL